MRVKLGYDASLQYCGIELVIQFKKAESPTFAIDQPSYKVSKSRSGDRSRHQVLMEDYPKKGAFYVGSTFESYEELLEPPAIRPKPPIDSKESLRSFCGWLWPHQYPKY
jgi:hypothetical protein